MTITICPETIAIAKDVLMSGEKFPSLDNCFEKSATVTAKHILFEQHRDRFKHSIPKVFVYIVMDQVFGLCTGYAADGSAGYHLKLKDV